MIPRGEGGVEVRWGLDTKPLKDDGAVQLSDEPWSTHRCRTDKNARQHTPNVGRRRLEPRPKSTKCGRWTCNLQVAS